MGRSPCCEKVGLKKGPWTPEEDQKLLAYIEQHGHGSWRALPAKAGLQRCGKSCRLRWTNYLRPDIKRGKFSLQEEQTIIQLHALLGNRWSAIATHLPKRTDNEIKNYWNTHLKKRLAKMGIDPVTHKPKLAAVASSSHPMDSSNPSIDFSKTAANLSHMAQWESARLEAEARLVKESMLRSAASSSSTSSPAAPPLLPPDENIHLKATPPPPCFDVLQAALKGSARVDLESPTSTLSFTESINLMMMPADVNVSSSSSYGYRGNGFSTTGNGDAANAAWFADYGHVGFTGMLLLDNSEECATDSDNGGRSCCLHDEKQEEQENNKSYWDSILDMVNSSPPHF